MNENGNRRKRTAAEKLRIVMTEWDPGVNVAELCRREGIVPTQFYGWKKRLSSSAQEVFAPKKGKKTSREEEGVGRGGVSGLGEGSEVYSGVGGGAREGCARKGGEGPRLEEWEKEGGVGLGGVGETKAADEQKQ